jgi:CheY-like chemotaxis protein
VTIDMEQVQILVVDDDALSRELFALLLTKEGYEVEAVDSGDAALRRLAGTVNYRPDVILTDIQMPGIAGAALAQQIRALCGPETALIAMSGSVPDEETRQRFDGFLEKPFTMEALAAAISDRSVKGADEIHRDAVVLDEVIYAKLAASMPGERLEELYALCLRDAETRIGLMRRAASENDGASYTREAHAIKGGCGMVGAVELQKIATSMEKHALNKANALISLDEFLMASAHLRRILVARASERNTSKVSREGAQ